MQPRRISILLPAALALGWGTYLGYVHASLLAFAIVTFSFATVWVMFDRRYVIDVSPPPAAFALAAAYFRAVIWSAGAMALAYWPMQLLHGISN
jgi:hypothetical protein